VSRIHALAKVASNQSLRRCGIGFALFSAAEYGSWLTLLIYAYSHGGASASGLLAFATTVPCVPLAPILATFVDRYQPGRALAGGFLAVAVGMSALALALGSGAEPLVVYVVAVIVSPTFNLTRPTMNVVLPLAVHTPDELTAGNAAMGWIEGVGVVAGPLLTSLLFIVGGPAVVIGVLALLMYAAVGVALPLSRELPPAVPSEPGSPLSDTWEALKSLGGQPQTAGLVGVVASPTLFSGALDVLMVLLAIHVLEIGDSGVGVLNAAFGAGGLVAVFATLGLVGRRRFAPVLVVSALVMGAAVGAIVAIDRIAAVLVLLAVANVGVSTFDVAGRTLLQRTGSPRVLGRTFGVLEGLQMLGLALGSLLFTAFDHLGGADGAIAGTAAIMPAVLVVALPVILRTDAHADVPIVQIGLLRAMALFRPLPPPELEGLARVMEPASANAGEVLMTEGEPGDIFYLIAGGELEVSSTTGLRARRHACEGVGEIALLHNVPRTATVTAITDSDLYTLTRDDFLRAVTGVDAAHHEALRMASVRLAELAVED
jgi:MFS family permease